MSFASSWICCGEEGKSYNYVRDACSQKDMHRFGGGRMFYAIEISAPT